MRHDLPRLWLAVGLFAVLASGCEHAQRPDSGPQLFASPGDARPGEPPLADQDELPGGVTPASYLVRPAEDGSAAMALPAGPACRRKGRPRRHEPARRLPADRAVVAAVEW